MRIVAIGDVHSDIENMMHFLDKVKELSPDLLIFSGDFIDVGVGFKGFEHADIAKVIIEELKSLGVPVLAVPGNQDRDILSLLESSGISVHGKGVVKNGVGFYGFGGAKTPFGTSLEPEESELESGLRTGYKMVKDSKIKVQITHSPPHNTRLDTIGSGVHVGSSMVKSLIEELTPDVAICAHIHEARGVDELGRTKVLNAGRFPEGYCGLVDLNIERGIVSAKIANLI